MTRLGENTYRFEYYSMYSKLALLFGIGLVILICFLLIGVSIEAIINRGDLGMLLFICIPAFIGYLVFMLLCYCLKGYVILDKDNAVITISKFRMKLPQKLVTIPLSEIMSVNQGVSASSTTTYDRTGSNTTVSYSHYITLHGKFGSHKFSVATQEDWDLFMTLLQDES